MKLREHIIIGLVGSAVLYFNFDWQLWRVVLFFISSVLIDADHYWDYLWRSRFADWSPTRMFRYYDILEIEWEKNKNPNFLGFSLLHTAEVFLAVYFLAIFWNYRFFITIFWGMLFHFLTDAAHLAYGKVLFIRAYSVIEYWIRKINMKKAGLDPDGFYAKTFELSKDNPKNS